MYEEVHFMVGFSRLYGLFRGIEQARALLRQTHLMESWGANEAQFWFTNLDIERQRRSSYIYIYTFGNRRLHDGRLQQSLSVIIVMRPSSARKTIYKLDMIVLSSRYATHADTQIIIIRIIVIINTFNMMQQLYIVSFIGTSWTVSFKSVRRYKNHKYIIWRHSTTTQNHFSNNPLADPGGGMFTEKTHTFIINRKSTMRT